MTVTDSIGMKNVMGEGSRGGECLILGGCGYIGWRLAERRSREGWFGRIVVADTKAQLMSLPPRVEFRKCDVRLPLQGQLPPLKPKWVFHLAAVHREPGHQREEYFETNLEGARNVSSYCEQTGVSNLFFTSSIAVYGPTAGPTDETTQTRPTTAYGISKLTSEWMFRVWQTADSSRRLVICRPGVIYGPGDPGNILRMIRALKRGYFFFPGSRSLRKSYGYVEGLLDSVIFTMHAPDRVMVYNYVERETLPLNEMVEVVGRFLGRRTPAVSLPLTLLLPVAGLVQALFGGKSPIHPARVRKVATSTHIVPRVLQERGFVFKYDFERSLADWRSQAMDF